MKQQILEVINVCNDGLFKAFFRDIKVREMVATFVSRILHIDKEMIKRGEFQGGELIKKNKNEKGKTSDVIIKLENGDRIIIEMNQFPSKNIFEKNTSYGFSLLSEIVPVGSKDYPKVYIINIDCFNKFKTKSPIIRFKLRDEEGNEEINIYESVHIIVENVLSDEYNGDEDIKKVVKLLMMKDIKQMKKEFAKEEMYMAAIRRVEELSTDPNHVGYYNLEEAHKQDLYGMWEAGKEDGIIMGRELGIGIGRELGIKDGQIMQQKEMINNMLAKHFDIETISEIVNMPVPEIRKLQKKLK